ncbi:OmpA family protein [Nocardia vinacea]|uniref:OmpA family protein n=1 Tax=Nocardia vinacea TaxID=96468 RepID=UPI00030B6BAF|nr:OmpA family protein [Nocardia vinacea]
MSLKNIRSIFGQRVAHEAARYFVLILASAILLIGLLCGCASSPASAQATAVTIVTTATSAEPRPALPDSLVAGLTSLAKTSKRPGDATVRIINSSTGDVVTRDLTPVRPGGQVQHADADADRQIHTAIDQLATTVGNVQAQQPGMNVLALLDRASQFPGDIEVVSSGLSTSDPLDFRQLGWDAKPDTVIDSLARQGQLANLSGRHVTFHGLGVSAGSQPTLPPFARMAVETLWTRLCQRAQAASCTVAHDAIATAMPVASLPVPVVAIPTSVTDGGCPVWSSFSDSVLHFAPGSATLPTNADDALAPIVQAAAGCNIQSIDVTGHVADIGNGRDDGDLSGQRARAVADRLVALGIPRNQIGDVVGHGTSEPVIPNFTAGAFDESKAQQNRRVELTFHRGGR